MLHRLVGRAIFADCDGVVGPHVQVRNLHEGGQTHGGTLVIGEHEEGAAVRTGVGAQQDAVGDGAHGELAHAEVELTAVLAAVRPLLGGALSRGEGLSALEVGLIGAAEVGGAAPEFRHDGCDGVQSGAGSATGGDVLADFESGLEVIDGLVEAFRKLAGLDAVVQGSLVRVGLAPCVVLLVPFLVGFETALGDLAGVGERLFVNVEGLLRVVAEELLEAGDGLGAQLGAVGGRVVGLARGRPCDQGVDLDELRLVRGGGAGLGDGVGQAFDVLLVGAVRLDEAELVGVPAVCLEALEHVLGQHQVGVAFDLDAVGIEDHGQVTELLVGGEGGGFAGDALFDIAFTADDPDVVVERGLAFRSFRIEQATLETLAIGEADGGGEALAQRTGGHFDARGQAVFRMTRGTGVGAATEVLQIVQGQAVAGEVQLDVLGEGGVATGKNEAIAAFPVGVVRIMLDEVLVQGVGDRRQGDGGTRVAVSRTLNRVGRQDLGHLDGAFVQLGLLEFGHGLLSFQLVGPRIRLVPSARRPHIAFPIVAM